MSTMSRDQLNTELAAIGKTRPDTCDKCGRPGTSRTIYAHVEDRVEDVVWMCVGCYRAANPPAAHPRREYQSKAPPYEVMKADYLSGMTYEQMGAKYGMRNRSNVHKRLKDRAIRRGEWPLSRQLPAFAIWQTVTEHLRAKARQPIVYVSIHRAGAYAPFCTLGYVGRTGRWVNRRREVWPSLEAPAFHNDGCVFLAQGKAGCSRSDSSAMFQIEVDVAEEWGYRPCSLCCEGSLKDFAAEHGLNLSALGRIHQGLRTEIDYSLALRLLTAIGEPIPGFLRPRVQDDRDRARPQPH